MDTGAQTFLLEIKLILQSENIKPVQQTTPGWCCTLAHEVNLQYVFSEFAVNCSEHTNCSETVVNYAKCVVFEQEPT